MARRSHRLPWAAVGVLLVAALLLTGCSGAALTPSSWPGVAVDEGTAYVASNQAVYAIDLANGAERWRFPAEPDRAIAFYAPPLVTDDGLIILGGFNNTVYAIHASDGRQAWTFADAKDRYVGGASQAGELILVPSSDHTLYALQRASGALVWAFETGAPLWAAPLVDGEVVYLPSQDHTLYALEGRTGKLLWSEDLGGALSDTPVLAGGLLLAGTFGQGLISLDPRTGARDWAVTTAGWVWGNPAVDDAEVEVAFLREQQSRRRPS